MKAHNEKCKKRGQYARCTTVEEYREKHPLEETLLYLGTKNVDVEALKATFEDFRMWIKEKCNTSTCGIELLNAALHTDEATPHIQFRKVYWYTDKDGNAQVSQTKALAELGYERPDTTKKEGRYNNAKMTFDKKCREKLFEFAKSHGVELIEEPLPKKEVGLSIDEYRAREQAREAWKAEQQALCAKTEKAEQELAKHEQFIDNAYNELEKAIGRTKAEIKQNEDIIHDQRQEIDNQREFIAFKRAKADEEAEQEAKNALEEREELAEGIRDEIIDMSMYYAEDEEEEQETQNVREDIQNTPKTPESIMTIPDTTKAQTPLKNDCRPSEAREKLRKEYAALNEDGEPTKETQWLLDRLRL